MILEHSFTVPTSIDETWRLLLDVDQVAPCMPGAALDTVDGDEFTGRIQVKIGAIQMTYKMKGAFVEKDEGNHRVVLEGSGKENRGAGTVRALISLTMESRGDSTDVKVSTDLNITGKPAQFGRGALGDIGGKILGQFADNLATMVAVGQEPIPAVPPTADSPTSPGPTDDAAPAVAERRATASARRTTENEPLDLLGVVAPSPDRIIAVASSVTAAVLALILLLRLGRR